MGIKHFRGVLKCANPTRLYGSNSESEMVLTVCLGSCASRAFDTMSDWLQSSQLAYLSIKTGNKGGKASLAPLIDNQISLPAPLKLTYYENINNVHIRVVLRYLFTLTIDRWSLSVCLSVSLFFNTDYYVKMGWGWLGGCWWNVGVCLLFIWTHTLCLFPGVVTALNLKE